jgi:hypothetical protein
MNIFNIIFFLILFIIILVYIKNQYLTEDFANQHHHVAHHKHHTAHNKHHSAHHEAHNKHHSAHHEAHAKHNPAHREHHPTHGHHEAAKKHTKSKSFQLTKRHIDLTLEKSVLKECKNGFCYYDLDEIMKRRKVDTPHGVFDAKDNKGQTFIVSGGDVPLLLNKGLQVDIKVVKDKVHYMVSPLK